MFTCIITVDPHDNLIKVFITSSILPIILKIRKVKQNAKVILLETDKEEIKIPQADCKTLNHHSTYYSSPP